jgi:hypothetical protein
MGHVGDKLQSSLGTREAGVEREQRRGAVRHVGRESMRPTIVGENRKKNRDASRHLRAAVGGRANFALRTPSERPETEPEDRYRR